MELVSASKMKKAVDRALATREYAALALELMINVSHNYYDRHYLLKPGRGSGHLLILIASNKGLCGGFNLTVAKAVSKFLITTGEKEMVVVTIGRQAERIARRLGFKPVASFVDLPDHLYEEDIKGVAAFVLNEFKGGHYLEVSVAYNSFVSPLVYQPVVRGFLPIKAGNIKNSIQELGADKKNISFKSQSMAQYVFEPGEEEVLEVVLPKLSEVVLYQAVLESLAAEHSARMIAMKNASENADELTEDLVVGYNQARQAAITQEIAEIVSGANN